MKPIIVAKLASMKPAWILKPPRGKHYATLMDDCLYGPFDSLAEVEEWAKAPWVAIDSPH